MTLLFIIFILPIIACAGICIERHRSVAKEIVVGLLTGWLGALLL